LASVTAAFPEAPAATKGQPGDQWQENKTMEASRHQVPAGYAALGATAIPYELLMQIQTGTMAFTYKGVPMLKSPFDLALYSKLLWEQKPRTVLEVGSNAGGSAVWLADQCRIMELDTHIHSVDIVPVTGIHYPRVTFFEGDGRKLELTWPREWLAAMPRPLLVIEDADHQYDTTAAVLAYLSPVVSPGEMIIVEDGILNAMRVEHLYNGGPLRALEEFLVREGAAWEVDRSYCDFFGPNVTWNTSGFLRRRA
jgi:cephalosporin hydroxylase